ncbi:hypothetical protein FH608_034635 [Nonomuraea phyllanthi]|uniref:DUF7144 domain-containing protein n=1 Tax=Nonomuraea phyllanthi TaxID=2219224 RepID=A0A5C4VY72_9ACTN|nr:hypothetical protein [Nonomuraea phyllanthi]KAB8190650.1 hypothetical protein FH608_034635 [Nonomuraea phyllanthi]QFY05824.1 hypothetical protein GBF35_03295 [Nonomuraea phyllanthi]
MTYQHTRQVTGWVGWIWFGGMMMILSGFFDIITGLTALLADRVYLQALNRLVLVDVISWGWVHLGLGIVILATGVAVIRGQDWARMVGVILVMLNALTQLTWIAVNPWWSLAVIAVDVLVLYALIVHGREAKLD